MRNENMAQSKSQTLMNIEKKGRNLIASHVLDFGADFRLPSSFAFESETKQAKWKLKREEKA